MGQPTRRLPEFQDVAGIEEDRSPLSAVRRPLEIHPNPARSGLAIRSPSSADRQRIKIFDVSGKMIKEIEILPLRYAQGQNDESEEVKISLKGIKPVIYFLKLSKQTKKFPVAR